MAFARIITTAGRKGGSAKTTTAMLIALGYAELYGKLGMAPVYAVSDPDSALPDRAEVVVRDLRPQNDNRDEELRKLRDMDRQFSLVIDGAARATDFDAAMARAASLVLYPITPDDDSLTKILRDLMGLSAAGVDPAKVWVLPSIWPTAKGIRNEVTERLFATLAVWRGPNGEEGWSQIMTPVSRADALSRITRVASPDVSSVQKNLAKRLVIDSEAAIAGRLTPYKFNPISSMDGDDDH